MKWVLIVVMANRVILAPPVVVDVFLSEAQCWAYVNEHNKQSSGTWLGRCMTVEEAKKQFAEVQAL